jgi:hypothetical protein
MTRPRHGRRASRYEDGPAGATPAGPHLFSSGSAGNLQGMPESAAHQLPPAAATEPFKLLNVHMELQEGAPLPAPQVLLALYGAPPYSLDGPKVYVTYFPPELARQVGHGMVDVATEALDGHHDVAPVDATAPGLVTASLADMRAATAAADTIEQMRRG